MPQRALKVGFCACIWMKIFTAESAEETQRTRVFSLPFASPPRSLRLLSVVRNLITTFDNLKLEPKLFAPKNITQIMLPKFARKAKFVVSLIEIDEKFDSERFPQIGERNVNANGL
jgi:hypothetical protein